MMRIEALGADLTRWTDRHRETPREVRTAASRIVQEVRAGGDAALRALTRRFDGADLPDPWLSAKAWDAAAQACPAAVQQAITGNLARIQAFHERQRLQEFRFEVVPGLTLGRRPVPFRRVGCYVPGGRASYPSTALMTVMPARVAGVEEIVVATPPRADGTIDPALAFAARAAGATAILRAGGAQAIAALAHGTPDIAPVEGIVGPGNAYVTAAKQLVRDRVRVDAPAGPSELLILADGTADPDLLALDLMAQAEHDPDAQVLLVCTDRDTAKETVQRLEAEVPRAQRNDIIAKSLAANGAALHGTLEQAIAFCNAYAPEHLEIVTADPYAVMQRIKRAGSVFLGPHTPVSLGDYGSGTNHVLPTMGFARITSGLRVDDFCTWQTWQEASPGGLAAVAHDVAVLADAEGLHAHADAVRRRL